MYSIRFFILIGAVGALVCSARSQQGTAAVRQAILPVQQSIDGSVAKHVYVQLVPIVASSKDTPPPYFRLGDAFQTPQRGPHLEERYGGWKNWRGFVDFKSIPDYGKFPESPVPGSADSANATIPSLLPSGANWTVFQEESGRIAAWEELADTTKSTNVFVFSSYNELQEIAKFRADSKTPPRQFIPIFVNALPSNYTKYELFDEVERIVTAVLGMDIDDSEATISIPNRLDECLFVRWPRTGGNQKKYIVCLPSSNQVLVRKALGTDHWRRKAPKNGNYQLKNWEYEVLRSRALMSRRMAGVNERSEHAGEGYLGLEASENGSLPLSTYSGWRTNAMEPAFSISIKNRYIAELAKGADRFEGGKAKKDLDVGLEQYAYKSSQVKEYSDDDPILIGEKLYHKSITVLVPDSVERALGVSWPAHRKLVFQRINDNPSYLLEDELTYEQFVLLAAWADEPPPSSRDERKEWTKIVSFRGPEDGRDTMLKNITKAGEQGEHYEEALKSSESAFKVNRTAAARAASLRLFAAWWFNAEENREVYNGSATQNQFSKQFKIDLGGWLTARPVANARFHRAEWVEALAEFDDLLAIATRNTLTDSFARAFEDVPPGKLLDERYKTRRIHLVQQTSRNMRFIEKTGFPVVNVSAKAVTTILTNVNTKLETGGLKLGLPTASEWAVAASGSKSGWSPKSGGRYTAWPTGMLGEKADKNNHFTNLGGNVSEFVVLKRGGTEEYGIMGDSYRTTLPNNSYIPVKETIPLEFVGVRLAIRSKELTGIQQPTKFKQPEERSVKLKAIWEQLATPDTEEYEKAIYDAYGQDPFWQIEHLRLVMWGSDGYSGTMSDQLPDDEFLDDIARRIEGAAPR